MKKLDTTLRDSVHPDMKIDFDKLVKEIKDSDYLPKGSILRAAQKFLHMKVHKCVNCFGILGNHTTADCPIQKFSDKYENRSC